MTIRQLELAQVVCDGTESRVSGCTINRVSRSSVSEAQVRCFQQTGIYYYQLLLHHAKDSRSCVDLGGPGKVVARR